MAGFQCRAAGWHSDEDNDVLVSHQITEQTCSEQSGSGQPPPSPLLSAPPPHACTHWSTDCPKGPGFSVPIPNPLAQRREDRTGRTRISKRSGGMDARCRGERLLQLGGAADACPSVSVCHFTSFKVTAARHIREQNPRLHGSTCWLSPRLLQQGTEKLSARLEPTQEHTNDSSPVHHSMHTRTHTLISTKKPEQNVKPMR